MCMTGDGTTITLGGSGIVGRIVSMGEFPESLPVLDDNDLSLSEGDHAQKCIGGVIEHDRWEGVAVFDIDDMKDLGNWTGGGAEQAIVVTYQPQVVGGTPQTSGGTTTGNGWLVQQSVGNLETNTRSVGAFAFVFKGGASGIAHAAGS